MAAMKSSNLWGKIAVFLVIFGVCAGTAMALSGSGTEEEPWLIQSLADFDEFAADANYWDDYTRLETDVNLAGRVYERAVIAPDVDDSGYPFDDTAFTGVFDGNEHAISNFTCDSNDRHYIIGLFGYVDDPNAGIRNLELIDPNVEAAAGVSVGSLVGHMEQGTITDCYIQSGSVSGSNHVSGLAGFCSLGTTITQSHTMGVSVTGGGSYVGGLIGLNDRGVVSKSYVMDANITGGYGVGGLIGWNVVGTITDCYAGGSVTAEEYAGGLVGDNTLKGEIHRCYSTCLVTGDVAGGLIGYNKYCDWGCNEGWAVDSFWDIETSGANTCAGQTRWSAGCLDTYGKTTSQLHQQSTFTNWDFINVWDIGENQTYPYLRTVPAGDINKDKTVNFLDVCIIAEQWCNEE